MRVKKMASETTDTVKQNENLYLKNEENDNFEYTCKSN